MQAAPSGAETPGALKLTVAHELTPVRLRATPSPGRHRSGGGSGRASACASLGRSSFARMDAPRKRALAAACQPVWRGALTRSP